MVTLFARRGALAVAFIITCLSLHVASAAAAPSLDATFGGGGITPKVFPKGKWPQIARGAVQQSDGKVLVPMALSNRYGHVGERPVLRYNLDGTLDRTYGEDGAAWLSLKGQKYFGMLGIKLQANGKPLVSGMAGNARVGPGPYFVGRLKPSGAFDRAFGHNGVARFSVSSRGRSRMLFDFYPLSGGKTLVVFERSRENDEVLDLIRLDKNGRVERGYGDRGVKTIAFAPGQLFPTIGGISIVGDEATILVDPDPEVTKYPCKVIRTNISSKGGRVKSFGDKGTVTIGAGIKDAKIDCRGLTPTSDGGIVIAGTLDFNEFDGTSAGVVYKLRGDGSRDQAFGTGGRVQGPSQDDFTGIVGLPSGDFLVLGIRYSAETKNSDGRPFVSTAMGLDSRGGLADFMTGGAVPQTGDAYQTNVHHAAAGTVVLYTRYSQNGELGSRIVKFTN